MFVGLFFLPYSPRWLASKDRWEEALQVLADLHGNGDTLAPLVQAEYAEIKEALAIDRSLGKIRWAELIAPGNFQRITSGIFAQ